MYRYFPSKRELALSVFEAYFERTLADVFEVSFQSTNAPVERLEEIYHRIYQMHRQICNKDSNCRGCPFVNIALEMASSEPDVRIAVDQCFIRLSQY